MKKSAKVLAIVLFLAVLVSVLILAISANDESFVARVDGVEYRTEEEAVLAIKDGSTVELLSSFTKNIDKSGVGYTVTLGEFSVPGFVSETHKVVTSDGAVSLVPASDDEIFTISYSYDGISVSVPAALGTSIKVPEEFCAYPKLNEASGEYTVLNFTLAGGNTVSGDATAIAETSTLGAVKLLWCTSDGGTVLKTDYYFPGQLSEIPEFSGTDIEDDHTPEWYSYGRIGWNSDDLAALRAGLGVSGEYKVRALMGKKAPDTVPGLKINLNLYSNYVLNFYVPESREGVSDLVISTVADGSVSITKLDPGTIEGVRYERFSYLFGAADTSIIKFYVVYTVDGERISYEMEYGVPVYAASAMQQLPCDAVCAKSLIINMANYADKALDYAGGDKTTLGARVYSKLLELYGEDYLAIYNSLSNDKFTEGGEIYVKDAVAETKLGEAMKYVEALSFKFDTNAPAYVLSPSSEAKAIADFAVFVKYGDGAFSEASYNADGGYYVSYSGTSEADKKSFSLSKMKGDVTFEFRSGATVLGEVKYNLASYVNSLIEGGESEASIAVAKAIYAFSAAAKNYTENNDSQNGNLPCMDFDGDHACDVCGKKISDCYDTGLDHACDVCGAKLNKLCRDADMNHFCDVCGASLTYKYVVVIGVDGAGAFFKDTSTPNLDKIYKNGAVTYDALTEIPSISAQNWGSILHGVKAGVHGCTNTNTLQGENADGTVDTTVNRFPPNSDIPSFLRVVKEAMPDADVASITAWANVSYGMVEDGYGIYMPYIDTSADISDREVTDTTLEYLNSCDPTLLFIHFNEVDTTGHGYGYGSSAHLSRITTIDGYIGEIYNAYAEKGLLDETLFIVTTDHGGTPTKPGGVVGGTHGGVTEAETHVMFAAVGKTVTAGSIGDMEVRDTAATVLYALGLEAPVTYTARVPSGIFGGVEAPAQRPEYVNPDSDRYHETEATPNVNSDKFVTNVLTDKNLLHYLPFDENASDLVGSLTAEEILKISYKDAYFGKGINLESGYVNIPEFSFGETSFTVALWIDTRGAAPDPVIFGNKDWGSGKNLGLALVINQSGKLTLNVGNGESRYDFAIDLPADYRDGWCHVMLMVDKENSKIRFVIDFEEVYEKSISATMLDVIYSADFLNIGQDGTGSYYPLTATLDEFMIFDGLLSSEEIASFAEYYGQKVDTIRNQEPTETPAVDSEGYIGNYLDKYIGGELALYLPFDGNLNASVGANATASGALSYEEGFFGEALRIKDGAYASVDGIELGTGSYTFSFWLKQESAQHDPVILSTKNWSGAQKGFLIASKIYSDTPQFTVNFGNGSSRADASVNAPGDFTEGWMHMTVVIDKSANTAYIYYDFELQKTVDISIYAAESVTQSAKLVIGQQLNGSYEDKLDAAIDELMIFASALDENGVRALSKYYGVEKLAYGNIVDIPEIEIIPDATIRDHVNVETPTEGNAGFVGDYLIDKNLTIYLPFDGDSTAVTGQDTATSGTISYEEGFFGEALRLKDGNYVTVSGVELGASDTTFAFWFKMESVPSGDPIFLSTKAWSAATKGFVLASRWGGVHFNLGDGTDHCYYTGSYPSDVTDGWCHVIVSLDRTNGNVVMYFDFGAVTVIQQGKTLAEMSGDPLSYITDLIIGNRPNGGYTPTIDAAIDELMVFDGAFNANDVRALAKYYNLEKTVYGDVASIDGMGEGSVIKTASLRNPNPNGNSTPDKDSGKYVTDFVTDKNLELYVNFDGESTTTATGQGFEATAAGGSLSYDSGVFGNAMTIKDGAYATVSGVTLGAGSYTFSFWLKMDSAPSGDPAIISTKDWNSGASAGFIICTKPYNTYTQTVATLVNGVSSDRVNSAYNNPDNCHSGWYHVTVVVDKENKKMETYFDFVLVKTVTLNDNLISQTITQTSGDYADMLRIGQDLEANYGKYLNASIDELMVFEGALDAEDVRSLSAYYGLEAIVFGE